MSDLRLLLLGAVVVGTMLAAAGWLVYVPRWPSPDGPDRVERADVTVRDAAGGAIPVAIWQPVVSSPGARPAPLILYSPGWGGGRADSSIQAANLASHGFVVVGCDDVSRDPATDPDRGVSFELGSDAATAATLERAGRHAEAQAARLLAVLRALAAGEVPALAGRLDLRRVGVLGSSIGGASGLAAALKNPRIVAVFNLDGGLFGPAATEIGVDAYFLLSSEEAFPSPAELASPDPHIRNYALISALDIPRTRRRMERPHSYWAQLPAAQHGELTDGLFDRAGLRLGRTNFQRRAMNRAIGALEVAFFRAALAGDPAPLHALAGRDQARSNQMVRWISPTAPSAGAASARQ